MKLRYIKASFILNDKVCTQKKEKNYIFKHYGFTFTIYHCTPYLVNVTGVKSFERMDSKANNRRKVAEIWEES